MLCSVDYIIAPLKVLQSLKGSVTAPDEKYSFVRRLSPQTAATYQFSEEEVSFYIAMSYIARNFGLEQSTTAMCMSRELVS